MQTDSEELLHAGNMAKSAWGKFLYKHQSQAFNPELVVTHQVGKAHTDAVLNALSIDQK